MNAKTELHIIMPGICGPLAEVHTLKNSKVVHDWIKLLSQSHQYPSSTNIHDVIAEIFDLSIDEDFPSAALCMLADGSYDASMSYMHADPVHLRADLDHAVLASSVDLDISEQESELLCDALNQHFNQDGLTFFRASKDQWFVSAKNKIRMKTTSLADATGRNVNFILPQGEDSRHWKKVLTEAQMLLHSHDINSIRENSAQQSINSLWFHGSGELPEYGNAKIASVCSDNHMLKGLAAYIKSEHLEIPGSADSYIKHLLSNRTHAFSVLHISDLEHLINYTDVSIWLDGLTTTLQQWIYPLIKLANNNKIEIVLYPCNGKKYQLSKYDGLKFWHKGTLDQHISCHKSDVQ